MQPLLQRKITCHLQLSSFNKSNELVYCVTIEQSIKIYHKAYFADFNNKCKYVYFVYYIYIYIYMYIYIYIYIYIPCGMCTFEFMGITDGKKEKMIFALKPSCLFYCG